MAGSFGTSLAILVINMGSGVLLARSLGPTDRGVLAAALLWPTIAAAVGTLGLMEAATYHAARATAPVATILGTGATLALAQALLFTGVGAVVVTVALAAHPASRLAAYLYLGFIPINILALFGAGVLNGLRRYGRFQAVRLLVIVATLALLGSLAAAGALTVRRAVLAYLAANLITLAATTGLLRVHVRHMHFDRPAARALLSFGLRSHSSTISSQLNERLDQLVVSIFLAPRLLGIYVIGVTMTTATYLVGISVAWVALPQIAPLEPGPERTEVARRVIQLTFAGSALISLPVFVLARPLITLFFGPAFAGAATITRILVVAVVCLSTNRVLEAVLRAIGRPLDAGAAELIALGATVSGLAVLLPALGLRGAAIASLLAYAVSMAWMCRRLTRSMPMHLGRLLVVERSDLVWLRDAFRRAARGARG